MMNELIESWEEGAGVTEFVILTAQASEAHLEALSTIRTDHATVQVIDVFALDFTDLIEDAETPVHGGELDTSLLLFLAPDLGAYGALAGLRPHPAARAEYRPGHSRQLPIGSPGSVGFPSRASPKREKPCIDSCSIASAVAWQSPKGPEPECATPSCSCSCTQAFPVAGQAQERPEAKLVVQQGGREIGRENFSLRPNRGRGLPGSTIIASARYPATNPTTQLAATLERTPEGALAKFQLDVESGGLVTVILAAGSGARLIVRTVAEGLGIGARATRWSRCGAAR